ncbi:MAG TPA: ABC transporter substrate-binding protein [Mycobacteriales bacterium]|nr:ABC transporter substrate-binding protein [Mycobacteriales bacterium]
MTSNAISRRRFGALAGAAVGATALSSCATRSGSDKVVTYWTTITDPTTMTAWNAMIKGFEKANPGYKVKILPTPSLGTGDATNLITAVRGHTGPDCYLIDRYTTAQYAGIGLLENLQKYVDQDKGLEDQYLKFALQEGQYNGDVYGMPLDTDSRGLFFNKSVLAENKIPMKDFDPKNGPMTIEKALDYGLKMNKKDKNGNYTRIGFIPWNGQGFWATWCLMYRATFFDNKTCQMDLTSPEMEGAYNLFKVWDKALNFKKVDAFNATYAPPGSPPQQGTFYTGRMAMAVDGNFALSGIKTYAPKLKYGVTYLPVVKDGDPPFTWSGGFAMVMPKGPANAEGGWKFIKYMTGPEGQRIYSKMTSHLPTWKSLLKEKDVIKGQEFFAEILKYSSSRPPLPVNAQLQSALDTATQSIQVSGEDPVNALKAAQKQMEQNMKQFCPFKLPPPTLSNA